MSAQCGKVKSPAGVVLRIPLRVTVISENVQRSTFDVRRSTFGVQRSAFNVRRSTFDVQRSAFNVRRSAFTRRGQDIGNNRRWDVLICRRWFSLLTALIEAFLKG